MASLLLGDPSYHETHEGGYNLSQDKAEGSGRWYFSRKDIVENSPSKRDGIDLKKETYLRKSYCTFLQDLGMRLKVPQVTIATAIIFCHRFFVHHSHAKNDRRTVATVCMFLAGKVEETPRPLKDVIMVSYEIINKKDPVAIQKIKQKEVYEQQKEFILLGERLVLATLGFDLNVHHPYKPLVEAIKKFKVAQNALAQVAWNFVNDGLRTSLCLQFKPHHIAAGAIFLAAKFLKVKLPSDGEKVWWQEFDVTPRQLEEVSNQMLELYEQNRLPPSQGSELEASTAGVASHRAPPKAPPASEDNAATDGFHEAPSANEKTKPLSSRSLPGKLDDDNHGGRPRATLHKVDRKSKDDETSESNPSLYEDNTGVAPNLSRTGTGGLEEGQEGNSRIKDSKGAWELKDQHTGRNLEQRESTIGQSPQEAIKMIDTNKLKATMKQRKLRGDIARKKDLIDEDDIIEKELEDGIELAAGRENPEMDRKESWSKPSSGAEHDKSHYGKHHEDGGDGHRQGMKRQPLHAPDLGKIEEGEVSAFNDGGHGPRSPKMDRKRKERSPPEMILDSKQRHDFSRSGSRQHSHHDLMDDRNRLARAGYSERNNKRHAHENHV